MFFDCFFGTDKPFVLGIVADDAIYMVEIPQYEKSFRI